MAGVEGKVVAITGASSGIGEATATLLAARGARVVLGARRRDRLEAVAARIRAAGGEAVITVMDVRRRQEVAGLVDTSVQAFGRLDVFVNNAGIGPISPLDELRVEEWEDMVDVNVKGVLFGIAAALPVFRSQGSGHLITIASTAAYKTVAGQAVYSATKFAARVLCEGLRQEAGDALRVTVVSPGFVATGFVDTIADPAVRAQLIASRDRFALPPDAVARAVAFAIEQPDDVDVGELVVRPTAQG